MSRRDSEQSARSVPAGVPHLPATSQSAGVMEQAPPPPPVQAADGVKSLAEELGLDAEFEATVAPPRHAYLVGVLPSCPVEVLHVGGIAFPRYTERVTGTGENTHRSQQAGAIAFLSDERYRLVIEAIGKRFVRRRGARTEVLVQGAPSIAPARREIGDEPLARHVYMQRRPELDGTAGAGPDLPKSLAEVATSGG